MMMHSMFSRSTTGVALALLSLAAACGDGDADSTGGGNGGSAASGGDGGSGLGGDATTPSVLSTVPASDATDVAINSSVSATFSEAMDRETLDATTFTVTSDETSDPVDGTVIYADATAVFWPAAHLASDHTFIATITRGAESTAGVGLAVDYSWTFTTGDTTAPGSVVDLGEAATFAILAKTGISTVPTSAITGDIGVSPAAATFITGFSLTADATNAFSTSTQVTGRVYAADYAPPTPASLTTSIGDMELAFTDAAGRAPDVTELGAGEIGGMTLEAGVYKWGTGLLIPTDITLEGSATDVWIFQIAGDLTVSSAANVVLSGGALARNVFWQVAGFADLGTTAHLEGTILSQTTITLRTGASIEGRLLAQAAVTIDGSEVVEPTR
jgi:hypothetical protein